MSSESISSLYHVYILVCRDQSLYTGITKDLRRRLTLLRVGRGTKYVALRRPFALVYMERHQSRARAVRRKEHIQKMSRQGKLMLINQAIAAMRVPA